MRTFDLFLPQTIFCRHSGSCNTDYLDDFDEWSTHYKLASKNRMELISVDSDKSFSR